MSKINCSFPALSFATDQMQLLIYLSFLSLTICNGFHLQKYVRIPFTLKSTVAKEAQSEKIGVFTGLKPDMFAHDQDLTFMELVSQVPLIEFFTRRTLGFVERGLVFENLGSSVLVGPQQMPQLYKSLVKASKVLDIEIPALYVKQNAFPTAYTLAYRGQKPFIVIHTGLLDLLNTDEVTAVLGHELGHLKCEHGVWHSFMATFISLGLPLLPSLRLWQRCAEYSCDRAALLVVENPKIVASMFMKLCGGSSKNEFTKELNVDAFLEQAKQLEKEKPTLVGNLYMTSYDNDATHPIPLMRAVELMKWSDSAQYTGLKRRAISTKL